MIAAPAIKIAFDGNWRHALQWLRNQGVAGVYDVAFEGLIRNVERRYRETSSETMKAECKDFITAMCSNCKLCAQTQKTAFKEPVSDPESDALYRDLYAKIHGMDRKDCSNLSVHCKKR